MVVTNTPHQLAQYEVHQSGIRTVLYRTVLDEHVTGTVL